MRGRLEADIGTMVESFWGRMLTPTEYENHYQSTIAA